MIGYFIIIKKSVIRQRIQQPASFLLGTTAFRFIPFALVTAAFPAQATLPFSGCSPCSLENHSTLPFCTGFSLLPALCNIVQRLLFLFTAVQYLAAQLISNSPTRVKMVSTAFHIFSISREAGLKRSSLFHLYCYYLVHPV